MVAGLGVVFFRHMGHQPQIVPDEFLPRRAVSRPQRGEGLVNNAMFILYAPYGDNPEIANDIEGQVRANADKLYATRRPGGKAAAAPAEGEPAAPATAKEPVVKAPARSSESELDIMVEE